MSKTTTEEEKDLEARIVTAISKLPETVAEADKKRLESGFNELAKKGAEWITKRSKIVVSGEFDLTGMSAARELRLEIRGVRLNAAKAHKTLKAPTLEYTRTLDLINRTFDETCTAEETALEALEKTAETARDERLKARTDARVKSLSDNLVPTAEMFRAQAEALDEEPWVRFESIQIAAARTERERVANEKAQRDAEAAEASTLKARLASAELELEQVKSAPAFAGIPINPIRPAAGVVGMTDLDRIAAYYEQLNAIALPRVRTAKGELWGRLYTATRETYQQCLIAVALDQSTSEILAEMMRRVEEIEREKSGGPQ